MTKPIIKHQTQDGVVHTRQTARTYTHVVFSVANTGKVYIHNWVGRPDLVAGAIRATERHGYTDLKAEPINGGNRPGCAGDVEGAYTPTQSGELA